MSIVLKNISKRFDKSVAVNHLDLLINDGDFITLLGPSGCGKTTTLRMIAGLETPTEGEIYIDNIPVFDIKKGIDVSPSKRDIGFLFQNYALWPHMTVQKNISFGLENLKWDKKDIDKRIAELAEILHIQELIKRYPAELSGGQQQRVAIARTLAPNPKVLLMDEPLSNLDAKLRMEMRAELKRLHKELKATFVYVTHDQLEAMTLSTKICLMKNGIMQQYSPPLTIYNTPANTFVSDFVGSPSINLLPVKCLEVKDFEATLVFDTTTFSFSAKHGKNTLQAGKEYIVGIRPEFIGISKKEGLKSTVISSLPSGVETIIALDFKGNTIRSLAFGSIDYEIGEEVFFKPVGEKILVFEKESAKLLCSGTLIIQKIM